MKKNIFTNNVYFEDFKNVYSFDSLIYSEKFTHLITDFYYLKNDLRKSINLYYNVSNKLKSDLNIFINCNFNNTNEIIDFIKNKNNLDVSFNSYFSDYSLDKENDSWFEINLKLIYVISILLDYKIFFDINPKEIPYINNNLKLYNLISKIINKNYKIDFYYSYFFNKFDFLKDAKSSYNVFNEEILSDNLIIYYKKEDFDNLNLDLSFFNNIKIKNNSKYCDTFEDLYYFKTNKFSFSKTNNFIIYDLMYSKINALKIKPYFIEEDKINHIINNNDSFNHYLNNNINLIFLKSISIYPLYFYKEYLIFFKNFYNNIIKN